AGFADRDDQLFYGPHPDGKYVVWYPDGQYLKSHYEEPKFYHRTDSRYETNDYDRNSKRYNGVNNKFLSVNDDNPSEFASLSDYNHGVLVDGDNYHNEDTRYIEQQSLNKGNNYYNIQDVADAINSGRV
ncbi:hypothetical protein CONCODRAFT_11178, partial [Conidiobolus coronatus NRRL 28638]